MEKVISWDGTAIATYRSGTGKPLLLVHGSTADHRRWDSITPRLAQEYTVYAMDRRGRGGSGDSDDYALLREAEDVAAVVEVVSAQAGEAVFVLGHSFGGVCSLEAALLTNQISRLILYEPPLPVGLPLYDPDFPERMQALTDRGEMEAALELFFRDQVKMSEQQLAEFRRLPMWQERIKIVPTLLREIVIDRTYTFDATRYAHLDVPTLLLQGSDRPPIFQRAIAALDAALPNSHVIILEGQQHNAMDTNPELFVNEVLAFLQVERTT